MAAQSEPKLEYPLREAFPLSCLEGLTAAPGFPIVEIQVNIHFVGSTNNNFIPDEINDPNDDNEPLLDGFWNGNLAA